MSHSELQSTPTLIYDDEVDHDDDDEDDDADDGDGNDDDGEDDDEHRHLLPTSDPPHLYNSFVLEPCW